MATEFERVQRLFETFDKAPLHRFPAAGERLEAPDKHGVYAIVAPRGIRVLHVGRTVTGKKGLKQRLANHLHGRSSFVTLYLKKDAAQVRRAWFRFIEVENPRIRALLEAYAVGQYCPSHIGYARSVWEAQQTGRSS